MRIELVDPLVARLASITASVAATDSPQYAADAILRAAVDAVEADGGAVGVVDPATGLISIVADQGYPDAASAAYPSPGRATFPLADAFGGERVVTIERRIDLVTRYPAVADLTDEVHAGCWVPVRQGARPVGALGVVFHQPRVIRPEEQTFLVGLAAVGALVLPRLIDGDGDAPARELGIGRASPIVVSVSAEASLDVAAPSWEAFTGQAWPAYSGPRWLGAVHPDEQGVAAELIRSRGSSPAPGSTSLRLWHAPSATWRHMRMDVVPVVEAEGQVAELVATFADVSDREAAEGQLTGLGRLLDSFLTTSPIGFALVDRNMRFSLINHTMAAANGLPADDHLGRSLSEAAPGMVDIEPLVRRVIEHQMPTVGLELQLRPARSDAPAHDWLINVFPVRRADGSLRGAGVTAVDVTDRNRAQTMIRELQARDAQDRFRSALDIMRDSVSIAAAVRDRDGAVVDFRIDYLNPVVLDVYGRDREGLVGTTMLEAWPEMRGSALFDGYVHAAETGDPFVANDLRYEVELEDKTIVAYYAIQALRFGDGLLVCARDTTAEREAANRLREAEVDLRVEHAIVERLQLAYLPVDLPSGDDFTIATCFAPVDERAEMGGDWYDAFWLPSGHLGLSIGDVTGHGLGAAALMAQSRLALRAYAFEDLGADPGDVLLRLDRLLARSGEGQYVTAAFALYDPATGRLCWARAGHPFPILCSNVRGTRRLDEVGGPPLGTALAVDYAVHEVTLDQGAFVLFYTDGLVERRGVLLDDGVAEVEARLRSDEWDEVGALCNSLTDSVRQGFVREDDVCILALRRESGPAERGDG